MKFRAIVPVILALIFNVNSLDAQTFRGAIQGTVNDSSGSAVPNTQVTVTGEQTNFARQVRTDGSGNYLFTELPLGSYKVTAVKSGFQKQVVTGIDVKVAALPRVDLTLTPGPLTEVIEIVGNVP
jgi:Carboxypeptidase regulatory-like domain